MSSAAGDREVLAARWAEKIKEHRTKVRRITQAELAEELEVTTMAVSMWERGERIPSAYLQVRLLQLLLIDPREMFAPVGAPEAALHAGAPMEEGAA